MDANKAGRGIACLQLALKMKPMIDGRQNMADLTEQQYSQLREMLEQRSQQLREELQRDLDEKNDHIDVATEAPDPGDSSFANMTVDLSNAEAMRDLNELRQVSAALTRMEDGSYGTCTNCGMDIPFGRLQAQPMAQRCARCQEVWEKTHGNMGRNATM
jgi:DnaK suppressor protein